MPKPQNLKRVLIIGSGPIVIGQACEFDYSGTQACKVLMKEGLEVILVNSNPATIMTDPEIATRVYIEPLKASFIERILEKEKPDAVIPTLGGQTALNLALELHASGVLDRLNIRMLGADPKVIRAAEDREEFRQILDQVGASYPKSHLVRTFEQGLEAAEETGFPAILRPNYTLGGGGGGIAYSYEEYKEMLGRALHESPTSEVLVEESILGWKEFELEVMRDSAGTFVVVCSIENFDPCGVHTGDSITVAPQQTLSDVEYQAMRDEARRIIDAVGLATGGANIQFAVHPQTGERVVIEMNPRVSRSSALASKATGFPIAKIAALLAIGYRLEEIRNDITKATPSCYEPALDYVVTKIPRFAFEKFPGSRDVLTTQMKSVGEVMGIGRTLKESMMKALAALETSADPLEPVVFVENLLTEPNSRRIYHIAQAFREGLSVNEVAERTHISPYFLEQIEHVIHFERELTRPLTKEKLLTAKRLGLSDSAIARASGLVEDQVRSIRRQFGISPGFEQVDTCAGEFSSSTPYYYSTYWGSGGAAGNTKNSVAEGQSVVILGSGPNRIGQGIEFDYSCVRGVQAFQKLGRRVVMINSNPETVSTDYDTADELYFEPLTAECVGAVMEHVRPFGFVAQLGGQTPINLAGSLTRQGFRLLGSSLETIDFAEDRGRFAELCRSLSLHVPRSAMVARLDEALSRAEEIGFPLICRPNYVIGGRRMEVVEQADELKSYFARHHAVINENNSCLMDQFLDGALEVDVDLVRGQDWLVIGGIVEHIEAAGVHSGDSMGVLPPQRLKADTCQRIEKLAHHLAERLNVLGHLNLQLAIKSDQIYVLEANPRSSRSVPFIAKASQIPLVDLGVQAVMGLRASELRLESYQWQSRQDIVSVKGVVFPFKKFREADSILGPEMKSTGESMGRGGDYGEALLKAFVSSHVRLPEKGEVFLSLRDKDKQDILPVIRELVAMGYTLSATKGTALFLREQGLEVVEVYKVHDGRPDCVDRIRSGEVAFVINTTSGRKSIEASFSIRRSCIDYFIPCLTESDAARAFVLALHKQTEGRFPVRPLAQP